MVGSGKYDPTRCIHPISINAGWKGFRDLSKFASMCQDLLKPLCKKQSRWLKRRNPIKEPALYLSAVFVESKWVKSGNMRISLVLQVPIGSTQIIVDHLELIDAQLTKEGMLAHDAIHETSVAAFQDMILYQRRAYFEALHERYNEVIGS